MTLIETADLAAVTGGCHKGQQPQQPPDPSQPQGGDPQPQAAPPQAGGMDWRGILSGILGMMQQFLQPQQQQQ